EPGSLEATIAQDVAPVARALELDAAAQARVVELTRRAFLSLVDEIEAREENPDLDSSHETVEALIAQRTDELHQKIYDSLEPSQRARYVALVGADRIA